MARNASSFPDNVRYSSQFNSIQFNSLYSVDVMYNEYGGLKFETLKLLRIAKGRWNGIYTI